MRGELDDEQAVIGFCGAPFTVAGYLVEGKPSRDFAKVEGADVPRAAGVARVAGDARRRLRALRARAGRSRRGRDPALRLVGRRAFAGRLRRVRRAVQRRAFSRPWTCRRSTSEPGTTTLLSQMHGRRDRSRLAHPARRGLGRRRRARRPGQPRSGRAARRRGTASRRLSSTSSSARAAATGTSSTSATGSFRRPTRTSSRA